MFGFLKGFAIWLIAVAAACVVGLALLHFMAWMSEVIYPIIVPVSVWMFAATLVLLLPMACIRPLRGVAAVGLMIASVFFGIATWVYGFLVTFGTLGILGIVVGIVLGGVGVVPVAIVACLWDGAWSVAAQLVVGIVLTFGVRFLSACVAAKADTDRMSRGFEEAA
jgi:hypothetical protein